MNWILLIDAISLKNLIMSNGCWTAELSNYNRKKFDQRNEEGERTIVRMKDNIVFTDQLRSLVSFRLHFERTLK